MVQLNKFTFKKGSQGSSLLLGGWSRPEIWGVKNANLFCGVFLPMIIEHHISCTSISILCRSKVPFSVFFNGKFIADVDSSDEFTSVALELPRENYLLDKSSNQIDFSIQEPFSFELISLCLNNAYFEFCDSENSRGVDNCGEDVCDPVFIAGIPRSGTSILYKILNHALNIENSNLVESFYFSWAFDNFSESFSGDCANAFLGEDFAGKFNEFRLNNFSYPYHLGLINLTRNYYKLVQIKNGRVVDKTPENVFYWEHIINSFPDAKIIFCSRPAVEVYASYKKRIRKSNRSVVSQSDLKWLDITCDDFVFNYNEYIRAANEVLGSAVRKNFFIIEYDKLVSRDFELIENLASFVGCDPAFIYSSFDVESFGDDSATGLINGGVLTQNKIDSFEYLSDCDISTLQSPIILRLRD